MTAKEYLTEVRRIDADIQMLTAEIDKIRLEMSGLIDDTISSSWPDGQPHGTGTGDPVGEKAAQTGAGEAGDQLHPAEQGDIRRGRVPQHPAEQRKGAERRPGGIESEVTRV